MKKIFSVLLVILLLAGVAACAKTPEEPFESAWEVTFTWEGGEKVFAIENLRAMTVVTFDAEKKGEVHSYTGVRLSLLLVEAGISDFETLTLEAADGYSYDITREEALDNNTILAFAIDGEDVSDPKSTPLMLVSTVTRSQAWVGQLKKIIISN